SAAPRLRRPNPQRSVRHFSLADRKPRTNALDQSPPTQRRILNRVRLFYSRLTAQSAGSNKIQWQRQTNHVVRSSVTSSRVLRLLLTSSCFIDSRGSKYCS